MWWEHDVIQKSRKWRRHRSVLACFLMLGILKQRMNVHPLLSVPQFLNGSQFLQFSYGTFFAVVLLQPFLINV